jgi:hypothetical protein
MNSIFKYLLLITISLLFIFYISLRCKDSSLTKSSTLVMYYPGNLSCQPHCDPHLPSDYYQLNANEINFPKIVYLNSNKIVSDYTNFNTKNLTVKFRPKKSKEIHVTTSDIYYSLKRLIIVNPYEGAILKDLLCPEESLRTLNDNCRGIKSFEKEIELDFKTTSDLSMGLRVLAKGPSYILPSDGINFDNPYFFDFKLIEDLWNYKSYFDESSGTSYISTASLGRKKRAHFFNDLEIILRESQLKKKISNGQRIDLIVVDKISPQKFVRAFNSYENSKTELKFMHYLLFLDDLKNNDIDLFRKKIFETLKLEIKSINTNTIFNDCLFSRCNLKDQEIFFTNNDPVNETFILTTRSIKRELDESSLKANIIKFIDVDDIKRLKLREDQIVAVWIKVPLEESREENFLNLYISLKPYLTKNRLKRLNSVIRNFKYDTNQLDVLEQRILDTKQIYPILITEAELLYQKYILLERELIQKFPFLIKSKESL